MRAVFKHERLGDRDTACAPELAQAPTIDMAGSYDSATQARADERGSYDPTVRAAGQLTTGAPVVTDEVLDVEDATRLLRIGRNTIYELAGRNEIPHRRLGKQIRFSRAAIMRWLDSWSLQGAKERQ